MVAITKNESVVYDISLRDGHVTVSESEALDLLNKLHGVLHEEIESEDVNVYSTSTFHTDDGIVTVYVDAPLCSLKLHFPIDVFDAMVNVSGYYGRK